MASIPGRSQGNGVSIARQTIITTMGLLRAVEWMGDECVGLELNDLIDKIHVYFLNRGPAFSESRHCGLGNKLVLVSWLPFI